MLLRKFKIDVTDLNFVAMFREPSRNRWQIGFGYNSRGCIEDIRLPENSLTKSYKVEGYHASLHDKLVCCLSDTLCVVSDVIIIFAIMKDGSMYVFKELNTKEEIQDYKAQLVLEEEL